MRASVILVIYNGARYLEACLEALLQETRPDDEIILVDNASSDGSASLVQERWPQAKFIRNEVNRGFAAACNQGAQQARGETLVFLNQDTRVLPGWLNVLVDGLCAGENMGLTTSKLLLMSQPERINLCGQDLHYTGLSFGRGALETADNFNQPQAVGAVAGASFAIRRALWEQLGGFDPAFFMYYEETDLSWRAALRGYTSWYLPGSAAYHDAALKPSARAAYYSVRNRIVLLLKHWKWPTLLFLLPALLLTELIDWVYLVRLGWGYLPAKCKAYAWLLTHPSQIYQARRKAQAGRKVSDARLLLQCTSTLTPKMLPLGVIGSGLIRLANVMYALNYQAALKLVQWLKL
jgi:GT2 family glycosyltransferase